MSVQEDLAAAGDRFQRARDELEEARRALQPLIVRALRGGMQQKDVVRSSGYTRESVRSIARDAGIERVK